MARRLRMEAPPPSPPSGSGTADPVDDGTPLHAPLSVSLSVSLYYRL
jgi:hypothetical protein